MRGYAPASYIKTNPSSPAIERMTSAEIELRDDLHWLGRYALAGQPERPATQYVGNQILAFAADTTVKEPTLRAVKAALGKCMQTDIWQDPYSIAHELPQAMATEDTEVEATIYTLPLFSTDKTVTLAQVS